jgi:uncharacterized membrane protein YoaT (DUF817 family)
MRAPPWCSARATATAACPCCWVSCLVGFFIWLAENISTFWGVWRYPNQGAWSAVHVSKWSSWSLLVVMTFTIIAHLKHIKASIHIAQP